MKLCLLKCSYPNGKEFGRIINTISATIDEALFTATKNGIRVTRLDLQAVVMVDLWIPRDYCLRFQIQGEQQKFGVSLYNLKKLLEWVQSESLTLEVSKNNILFRQRATGIYTERTFVIPLHFVKKNVSNSPPETKYFTLATMGSKTFSTIIKGYNTRHPRIRMTCRKREFTFEASSHDEFSGETKLSVILKENTKEDNEYLKIKSRKNQICQILGLNQLNKFVHASDFSNRVEIGMIGCNKPLRFHFQVGDSGGHLRFFVAPKIENIVQ